MEEEIRIDRIDHVYVTVSELSRSEKFYDALMQALGFRKRSSVIAGDPHVHYFNAQMQYTIRGAHGGEPADPYRPGALHHLCFQVPNAAAVDTAHRRLRELGIEATEPRIYAEYRPDYYATFFRDPDGIRLELVCDTELRRLVRSRWAELTQFVDPMASLLRDAESAAAQPASSSQRRLVRGSLFEDSEPPDIGERFEPLANIGELQIERIVSSARPESGTYDQDHDEWVLLVRGTARLEIGDENIELKAGDYVLLPTHLPHRVIETSAGALWLALHAEPRATS